MSESAEVKIKILVVDDNEQNRALARATLEEEGYEILVAADGNEGVRMFEEHRPDCVLMDVRMPGLDGFAACEKIRALSAGVRTPIVFLTALRDVDTFDAALRAGGDDFLTKPIRPTELALRVRAAIELRRLDATNREYYELVRRQRDDLLRLELQKERLMSFVVHDLKNPVSNIDLHAQMLLREKELSDRSRASAESIRDEVRSLMRLLLNLLDISKSEEGRLSPKLADVDIRSLVSLVFESLAVRARAKAIKLENSVEASVMRADPDLLRRVLENLLENALRYAPEESTVRVTGASGAGVFRIGVADQGPGVPAAQRETIFDRFVQVTSRERASRSGRGLGLAFCRLAVEAHGGRIWVEDAAPGALICFELPNASA
jgi:signal transduction histidine kinase